MAENDLFEFFHSLYSVDSTNEYLKQFLARGQAGAVVARQQREGKGRHGRRWYSPPGLGLYTSFLVFPGWHLNQAPWLNRLATLAVVRSITRLPGAGSLQLEIKQPNDVLANGKKIAGVLIESASLDQQLQWAIVGIGVNLAQTSFQIQDARVTPTSLLLEEVPPPHARRFGTRVAHEFSVLYREVDGGQRSQLLREFEASSARLPHKENA